MKAFAAALLFFAAALSAVAQVPLLMSYQGHITDSSGNAIGAGAPTNRTLTFKFYTSSSSTTPVYAESQVVTIAGGDFSVLIGNGTGLSGLPGFASPASPTGVTLPAVLTGNAYLGVTLDSGAEISPRQQLVSAAYAFRAKLAEALVDGSVKTASLATSAVTTNTILDANVTTSKIADGSITRAKIESGAINSDRIADGSIATADLADGQITNAKIADGTIVASDLADGQITSAKIADGTITAVDIADGAIANADIAAGSVTSDKIANSAVSFNKLDAGTQWALCPPGAIMPYAGDTAPAGWLLCNGQAFSRTSYSALFAVIGTRFGTTAGDNFLVPDTRGQFLRGRDGGANRDPDRNSRTALYNGGATGDAVGSIQGHALASHSHGYNDIYYSEAGGAVSVPNNRGSNSTDTDNAGYQTPRTTDNAGGNETRPMNLYVNYIIKQ